VSAIRIIPYEPAHEAEVLDLAIAAWAPVFAQTRQAVPAFVFDAFYPAGWERRQRADIAALLRDAPAGFWLAVRGGRVAGFVGLRLHPEDRMGEIVIIATLPAEQGRGIGRALMSHAEQKIRDAGMRMVMVETVDDPGHAPARRAYEGAGYERWPVARYFKRL
jgi:GNAT superfamily N-acetyltransferase